MTRKEKRKKKISEKREKKKAKNRKRYLNVTRNWEKYLNEEVQEVGVLFFEFVQRKRISYGFDKSAFGGDRENFVWTQFDVDTPLVENALKLNYQLHCKLKIGGKKYVYVKYVNKSFFCFLLFVWFFLNFKF